MRKMEGKIQEKRREEESYFYKKPPKMIISRVNSKLPSMEKNRKGGILFSMIRRAVEKDMC